MTPRPLPTTKAITGILEALSFFRDPEFARRRFDQHGDVFETRLLGQRMVFIRGDQAIQDLLAQSDAVEGWWPDSVRQLLGMRSLANRNGADHKARRRVVGQLFSKAALHDYSPSIVALVNDLAESLPGANKPTALAQCMREFAFSVIATTVLGVAPENRDALFKDFEIWTRALFSIPLAIPGTPFSQALSAKQRLLTRLKQLLNTADNNAGSTARRCGISRLTGGLDENGEPLSVDDLAEQLLLLLFAGYETTASSLSCLMRALLMNPEVQLWLDEEIQTIPWPPSEQQLKAFDSDSAPRLNAVINEVMRLTPPVGGFFRRTRHPISIAGIMVPAERVIQVALAASNRLDSADDLEHFRPQRHLEATQLPILRPFGGGERVCLGQALAELEIRLMVVGLLRQLTFELVPGQDLTLKMIPSPVPEDGLLVRVARTSP